MAKATVLIVFTEKKRSDVVTLVELKDPREARC